MTAPLAAGFVAAGLVATDSFADTAPESERTFADGRVIVRFATTRAPRGIETGLPDVDAILRARGVREIRPAFRLDWSRNAALKRRHGLDRVYALEFPTGADVERIALTLSGAAGVVHAEPDVIGRGGQIPPDDTHYSDEWHLENSGQSGGAPDADIDAVDGWAVGTGSPAVVLAVLDTGIDSAHPEFSGRIVAGFDFVNNDSNPEADHSHGTLAAGIALANANNAFQVAGVDWNAKLMPVKVLNSSNLGLTTDLVDGIVWATDNGADVISMSLINYPCSGSLRSAIQYARDASAVPVASAGNNGIGNADTSGPGCIPESISVGATDHDDRRASFSATGAALDIVAPGQSVRTVKYRNYTDGFSSFSGTSAAAPVVSGMCSLLLALEPGLLPEEVRTLLQSNAEDGVGPSSEDTPGRDDQFGWGRVNLASTLSAVFPATLRRGGVTPATIGVGQSATFSVVYSSASDTPPDHVRLVLSGPGSGVFDMTSSTSAHPIFQNGDFTDGEQYDVSPTLNAAGTWAFHFEAAEGGVSARHPEAGELSGPAVTLVLAEDHAIAEASVDSAFVLGDYTSTWALDNVSEALDEVVSSGGPPPDRFSTLDHRFTFDVTGGDAVSFHVNAERVIFWPAEDDRYDFSYSTDGGSSWLPMLTVSTTNAGIDYQTFPLPPGTAGDVRVRVEDTNSTAGTQGIDRVFVDHMFFRSEVAPTPGEATDLVVTGLDGPTGALSLAWNAACAAADHNLVYGPLASVGTYGYTGQVCGVGATGEYAGFAPGPGSWFFLVVGTDGTAVEGSYGTDGTGAERPEQTNDPVCPFTRDLTFRCDVP